MKIRRSHIRKLAQEQLVRNVISTPPVGVQDILRALKIDLRSSPGDVDISGFLVKSAGGPAVIGVNNSHHPNRQRFTMAHELGHYLLHDFSEVHIDRSFFVKLRSAESSKGEDWEEIEANLFAAELLMPKPFLERDLENISFMDLLDESTVKGIADKYEVSPQALTIRFGYLGFLPQE